MKIYWLDNVTLIVVDSIDDDENIDDHELEIKRGEIYQVDIVGDDGTHADIQFGNGSVAFRVLKDYYREISDEGGLTGGDRSELACPTCGAPQNELREVGYDCLEFACDECKIQFKIETTYKITDIKGI